MALFFFNIYESQNSNFLGFVTYSWAWVIEM